MVREELHGGRPAEPPINSSGANGGKPIVVHMTRVREGGSGVGESASSPKFRNRLWQPNIDHAAFFELYKI